VVALAGDLSMLHDQNGFLLLASEEVHCTFVVINNDGGGIFSFLPQAGHGTFERVFGTPHGVNFAQLAATYRIEHSKIDSPAALVDAVSAPPEGVRLLEVETDRAENRAFHEETSRRVAHALEGL
ncbi:MAG: 2-succinyl-5-enolpyruvyl-6-hydroxy-3-cyclohexene-1-carboxylate synthase, partial [Actinobacteria bacterium]|nr:2-succinyl-5-enolpyruvyl-6-hydroxy-3-cyclohexene-1-carboxylate synthase [Actinomycetota bacterium]